MNIARNIVKLTSFSFLALASLFAESPSEEGSVSSTNASYDGNALILTGHVLLDHGLGKMNSEHARLERQEAGKDFPFSVIHLKKEVLLSLKNNSDVRCETADFDFTTLKGRLLSKEGTKVIYTDHLKKRGDENPSFRLMSESIDLNLSKKGYDGNKTTYEIESILAKDDVVIDYLHAFTLYAGQALYRRIMPKDVKTSTKEFQGIMTAHPKDAQSKCHLTHQGDVIDADTVDLDTIHSKITMYHPKGVLLSTLVPHLQKGELKFDCDHLSWDHAQNVLTLKGSVHVHESAMGTLVADEELQISQTVQNGQRLVKRIRTKGKTVLHYTAPGESSVQTLLSYGSLVLDREHLQATLDSPEIDGKVPLNQQIYYEDEDIGIHGNKAILEYSIVDSKLQPTALSLKDKVRLFSRDPSKGKRCALADRLHYSPLTHTLILSADPGKKVLFYDEVESLRIVAPEIHIVQDPETKKQTIQGIGKVQFTFSDQENSLLTKLFPHQYPAQ